ncbi:MAG: M20/M25/M40 family metallo-hydrolase [Rhodospirillaceae bacterium]|nr:M20/M25/M40 family metallo-hydrolase [Rhodospirillaceae bacterium]
MRILLAGLLAAFAATSTSAAEIKPRADQLAFRDLYKELVETNTTLSAGSCTLAAERMAKRLKAAGYPDADLNVFVDPAHPKEGGLLATLHGADPNEKAILLLAHIDVVEANRDDWVRDPFKLIEEDGYFYARGSSDDKSMAAIWTDSLIRYKQEKFQPKRTLRMALTCGEETSTAFNGVDYLIANKRPLIDAAFAINEGGSGMLDDKGNRVVLEVQMGEKVYQDFQFEVTSPGGHSSQPVKDNAIYQLSAALGRVGAYQFPVTFNDTTRAYFKQQAAIRGGETAKAITALLANPKDEAAAREVAKDKAWNSMMRTTCVATMVNAGHAVNALPQRARANVNCRILPGTPVDDILRQLTTLADDPAVAVTVIPPLSPTSPPPPLTATIMKPLEKVAAEIYPGTPILPTMITGATDGAKLNAAGIPTYGIEGIFVDPDLGNIHGLNERVGVKALYDGRDFLFKLVKLYATQ